VACSGGQREIIIIIIVEPISMLEKEASSGVFVEACVGGLVWDRGYGEKLSIPS
jgi:hypothetical protein